VYYIVLWSEIKPSFAPIAAGNFFGAEKRRISTAKGDYPNQNSVPSAGLEKKRQNFSLGRNNPQNISKPVKKGLAFPGKARPFLNKFDLFKSI